MPKTSFTDHKSAKPFKKHSSKNPSSVPLKKVADIKRALKALDPNVSVVGKKEDLLERYWSIKNGSYQPPQPRQPKKKETKPSGHMEYCKEMIDMLEMDEFYDHLNKFAIPLTRFDLPSDVTQITNKEFFFQNDERIKKAKIELLNAMSKPKNWISPSKSKKFQFENLDELFEDPISSVPDNDPEPSNQEDGQQRAAHNLNGGNPTTQVIFDKAGIEKWKCLTREQLQNHQRTIDVMEKLQHIETVFQAAGDLSAAKAALFDFNWDDLDDAVVDMLIDGSKNADFSHLTMDPVAMSLFKKHFPQEKKYKFTTKTSMNGFCLDSSISCGLTGTSNFEFELRLKTIRKMIEDSEELTQEANHKGWAISYKSLFEEIRDICKFGVYEKDFGTLNFSGEYSGMYSISGKSYVIILLQLKFQSIDFFVTALARATGIKIDVFYPAENGKQMLVYEKIKIIHFSLFHIIHLSYF